MSLSAGKFRGMLAESIGTSVTLENNDYILHNLRSALVVYTVTISASQYVRSIQTCGTKAIYGIDVYNLMIDLLNAPAHTFVFLLFRKICIQRLDLVQSLRQIWLSPQS